MVLLDYVACVVKLENLPVIEAADNVPDIITERNVTVSQVRAKMTRKMFTY